MAYIVVQGNDDVRFAADVTAQMVAGYYPDGPVNINAAGGFMQGMFLAAPTDTGYQLIITASDVDLDAKIEASITAGFKPLGPIQIFNSKYMITMVKGFSGAPTQPIASTDISDSTATGRALITAANAAAGRTTLGAAASGANSDVTSLTGLTTPLSAAQGGTGNATGLAATATALATSRTIALSGGATASGSFNGTANLTLATTLATPTGAVRGGALQAATIVALTDSSTGTSGGNTVAAVTDVATAANAIATLAAKVNAIIAAEKTSGTVAP